MDANALLRLLGMGSAPARSNPLELMAMGSPPPSGGSGVMSDLDRARRLKEIKAILERQRMASESGSTGPRGDMQAMQALMGMLATGGRGGIMPSFSAGRSGE